MIIWLGYTIHSQASRGSVMFICTGIFSSEFPGLSTKSSDTLRTKMGKLLKLKYQTSYMQAYTSGEIK